MKYEIIKPPEKLKGHIRSIWKLEGVADDADPKTFRIIADGSPGIVFHQPERGPFYQNTKKMPSVCLYGQATEYAELKAAGNFSAIGFYLYPNALRTLFGLNANEITNTCLDMDLLTDVSDKSLSEKFLNTVDFEDKVDIFSSFITNQAEKFKFPNNQKIDYALDEIIRSNGNISLKDLQKDLSISEKSLQRNFKKFIGITPKIYSRICQFQSSLNQLKQSNYMNLADIAYDNEYSDQSHFIRSFRKFSGYSPNQFHKQANEVVANLTRSTS